MIKMKVMGVGGGAREHALAEAIARSRHISKIYWVSELRNPGIYKLVKRLGGEYVLANTRDTEKIADLADKWHVDIVVIGPEEPNFYGVPDKIEERGIPCIGAKRELSIIEMSKAELRRLQWRYNIPGRLLFRTYRSYKESLDDLERYSNTLTWLNNVALKPARQAGGKGVKIIEDMQLYLHQDKEKFKERHVKWLEEYMGKYSDIEEKILLEEKVWGPEYTIQAFADGKSVIGMPLVQDNKNAYDFDIGPETGGMGSYTGHGLLLPFITIEEYNQSLEIVRDVVDAIQKITGEHYHGFIAGQMMLTEVNGPTLIEVYSRLGDPEGVNAMALLKTDIIEIFEAIINEHLSSMKIEFSDDATVVKALAPKGYPDFRQVAKNHSVYVDEDLIASAGCKLYWGSAHLEDDNIFTSGSRLLEILSFGDGSNEASEKIEKCLSLKPVRLLDGWGLFHRKDIGSEEMVSRRTILAERVRHLYKYRREKGILGKRVDWIPKIGKINPAEDIYKKLDLGK